MILEVCWDGLWALSLGLSHTISWSRLLARVCEVEPYIGYTYLCSCPCPHVLGGHGCDIIGNVT